MRKIVVIGLGNFGLKVAEALLKKGALVSAFDRSMDRVEKAIDMGALPNSKDLEDCTDEEELRKIGIQDADVVIVTIGENSDVVTRTVMILKRLGVKEIWARAKDTLHEDILGELLDDQEYKEVINLEKIMAQQVADRLAAPGVIKHIRLARNYASAEIEVCNPQFVNKQIREINLKNASVVGVIRKVAGVANNKHAKEAEPEENWDLIVVDQYYRLQEGDILVVVGNKERIEKLEKEIGG